MTKKNLTAILSLLIVLSACFFGVRYYRSSGKAENKIISLEIMPFSEEIVLHKGEKSEENFFEVIYENGFSVDDISFVCADENIAAVKYSFTDRGRYVCFTVTANQVGETDLYFLSEKYGVLSSGVKIIVLPESTEQETTVVPTQEDKTEPPADTPHKEETPSQKVTDTVYVAPTGKRYHLLRSCAGKNGYEVKKSEAISSGKTPCKKCAGG